MFSIFILVGLCPRGWIVTLSFKLGHIRQVWKITIFKPKLALWYSLLARYLAAGFVGNTLFSTYVYHNTIYYTSHNVICHKLLIVLIPIHQQYKKQQQQIKTTFSTANANAPTITWNICIYVYKNISAILSKAICDKCGSVVNVYIKHRRRSQISQELWHICSKRVTNEILFFTAGKNTIWEE